MVKNVKRGDIYYVMRNKSVGHEMRGGRPAIVVSNDTLNSKLDTVEVVYLTTSPRKSSGKTHVIIKSADTVELEVLIDSRKAENEKKYQAVCEERDRFKQLAENYRTMLIHELLEKR